MLSLISSLLMVFNATPAHASGEAPIYRCDSAIVKRWSDTRWDIVIPQRQHEGFEAIYNLRGLLSFERVSSSGSAIKSEGIDYTIRYHGDGLFSSGSSETIYQRFSYDLTKNQLTLQMARGLMSFYNTDIQETCKPMTLEEYKADNIRLDAIYSARSVSQENVIDLRTGRIGFLKMDPSGVGTFQPLFSGAQKAAPEVIDINQIMNNPFMSPESKQLSWENLKSLPQNLSMNCFRFGKYSDADSAFHVKFSAITGGDRNELGIPKAIMEIHYDKSGSDGKLTVYQNAQEKLVIAQVGQDGVSLLDMYSLPQRYASQLRQSLAIRYGSSPYWNVMCVPSK